MSSTTARGIQFEIDIFLKKRKKKKEHFFSFYALGASVSDSSENHRRDTEKMNSGILNIKDEGVAQQLFLFIFH